HLTWHFNCLEMLAVFLALKHFLPDLRGRHVLQSPHLFVTEDLNVTPKCSQIETSHNSMYWFRKTPTEPLEQIGFIFLGYLNNNFPNPEEDFKHKIDLAGDGRSSATLTIKDLTEDNSGVYYCAARRHSVLNPHNPTRKHTYHI
uniref:Ig-like domain-containing protein n=1 Tax=Sinocyclocheilus grahami TaxID=75366 RepID=A0A672MZE9_SINGR